MLVFEVAQDVLQPLLDAAEIRGAGIVRCLQPLEQVRYALFEMSESRRVVVADLQAVDAIGQPAQRGFELLGIVAWLPRLATFQRRGQPGDALFEQRKGIAVVARARQLIDLGGQ